MPINIYSETKDNELAWLCNEIWELPTLISELEKWLETTGKNLPKGEYVVDIGFSVRKDARGGGSVLSKNMMRIMSEIGMEIYFSEYLAK